MVTTRHALEAATVAGGARSGLRLEPHFTTPGVHPYEEVEWETRNAVITDYRTGDVAFEQRDVEFPKPWSLNATTIVAQKYFRGTLGTPERERSVKHMIDRVADTVTDWGRKDGYFADGQSATTFNAELKHLLVHQKAAFNSPVWFNVGVESRPQASACFILSVEDTMSSILNWYVEEGTIFKGGSGSGVNLSRIRSSKEHLRGGGQASGPVSFMRGADASAGTIKSGGKTRRAAKMVILDVDHPDVEEFIWCKQREELKARALREAGFDMDLDGLDSASIQYQNANNSVRVTDDFMRAVEQGRDWELTAVTTGETVKSIPAADLMRQIAQAAWECADPGMQYDTTINDWHTTPNAGRINGSNPCFTGDSLVHTDKGLVRFDALITRVSAGESFGVYTHDATNAESPAERVELTTPEAFMITGRNPIVRLRFSNGMELRCTPAHKVFTTNRGYVPAAELTESDRVKVANVPTPAVGADWALPISTDAASYRSKGDHKRPVRLPEKWSTELAHYLGWLVGDGSVSGNVLATIYGGAEEQQEVLPRHRELLAWLNADRTPTPSVQANGTAQLRLSRRALAAFFAKLGVRAEKAPYKRVPEHIFGAPREVVGAFLTGLFDADGCAVDQISNGTRYVRLGSSSEQLLVDVQRLLASFGIFSRVYRTAEASEDGNFSHERADGSRAVYPRAAAYQLRISGRSVQTFAAEIGFSLPSKVARLERMVTQHRSYATDETVRLVSRTDDGFELTYNLSEPRNHSYIVNGVVVRNCSEYMHLDNSACNLASLNLRKFEHGGEFDVESFRRAVEIVFTAQEILVGNSSYPTAAIGVNAKAFRQLGLGYANLGGLLMSLGIPYDSDAGRAWGATITALMTGQAYRTSVELAKVQGPFDGYAADRDGMLRVLRKHRDALQTADEERAPEPVFAAARAVWDETVEEATKHGVRNAQASVLAPTGTIGLMMDCDTTGIEPDLGLVKMKKLVGGGSMKIVNRTVPEALKNLGYQPEQVEAIVDYIDDHATVEGAPAFKQEHLPVFDCAMGERSIAPMGHVRMMAAVQPWLSGAISKCVTGDTRITTGDGLIRIGDLHRGEAPDSFRDEIIEVASQGGTAKTDAFYYGGKRAVRRVVLRSGHTVTGTDNHRVHVAGRDGLEWRYLDELQPGEYVAVQYGSDLWSVAPADLRDFRPSPRHGSQLHVSVPVEMSQELAFLLGAYASEGHCTRNNWTIVITNSEEPVLRRIVDAWRTVFGVAARITRQPGKCPAVVVSSKTIVEFFDHLECGDRASNKRIPDVVLRSPREVVLSFLQGLFLDAYPSVAAMPKLAICLDSGELLDDLQAVLTNLGIVHGRVTKYNRQYDKSYDEVYAVGAHAGRLAQLVPFLEPDKATRAGQLTTDTSVHATADVVPGVSGADLYRLVPQGVKGRWRFLVDPWTRHVSRHTLERLAEVDGVVLPGWLQAVLDDGLHFSPVASVEDAGVREVFDLSVPSTHAFVGNGVANHNTVNLPESATVEDVEHVYMEGWRLGLKALAIYRDNCKVAQPLSVSRKADKPAVATDQEAAQAGIVRRRLPRKRPAQTFSFTVGDAEGYMTAGEYPGDGLGEIFVNLGKQGSTLSGVMDAFAISVSIGLQYGVPLEAFVSKFINMRFEPAGMTDDAEVKFASSIVDYMFRRLAIEYLPAETRHEMNIYTMQERTAQLDAGYPTSSAALADEGAPKIDAEGQTVLPVVPERPVDDNYSNAPMCYQCGVSMVRAGSCHCCPQCGTTSGCS